MIIFNPAEPPLTMRDTIHCLVEHPGGAGRRNTVGGQEDMIEEVALDMCRSRGAS
jgi:acetaldehyde dehydrogenase (acetylating)